MTTTTLSCDIEDVYDLYTSVSLEPSNVENGCRKFEPLKSFDSDSGKEKLRETQPYKSYHLSSHVAITIFSLRCSPSSFVIQITFEVNSTHVPYSLLLVKLSDSRARTTSFLLLLVANPRLVHVGNISLRNPNSFPADRKVLFSIKRFHNIII